MTASPVKEPAITQQNTGTALLKIMTRVQGATQYISQAATTALRDVTHWHQVTDACFQQQHSTFLPEHSGMTGAQS